ncbi:hypothetical protein QBC34DRAFT_186214 [Podospora aff. communis PSN243]|uniref:Uncharacterized protein n=1 Tax=Podospora aff. communis PSN243 TaxID=3040156 RepID=A0AAV9GA69_9PEZI|nr:hypothetical protein QBC34DRAFT_186214 [Podospora aff. communis PSN243]
MLSVPGVGHRHGRQWVEADSSPACDARTNSHVNWRGAIYQPESPNHAVHTNETIVNFECLARLAAGPRALMRTDMEDTTVARSLAILTRSTGGSGSNGNVARRPSNVSIDEDITSGAVSPSSSRRNTSQSSTPPLDDESPSHGEMISGFGCLFDNIPLPRDSTLKMGSESGSATTTATSSHRSQTPELDENSTVLETPKVSQQAWTQQPILTITPKAEQQAWNREPFATPTSTRTMSTRDCIVVQPLAQLNLVTPDPSPIGTKRAASPPSAPRPAKRPRSQGEDMTAGLGLGDILEDPLGPSFKLRKIANARQRGAELAVASLSNNAPQAAIDKATRSREQSESEDSDGVVHQGASSSDLESPIKIRSSNILSRDLLSHKPSEQSRSALEIEWFTEAEIEAQLSTLLVSYRAFYLEREDSTDVTTYVDADSARIARQTLKAIFEDQLCAAEDEGLLLGEEEEDVMNLFMTYIKEMEIPTTAKTETFPSVQSCLDRVAQLGTIRGSSRMDGSWKFIRKIT